MGLDMYLSKAKRINGATANDIDNLNNYFSYVCRPEKYRDSTMKKWCGVHKSEVNLDLAESYIEEYKTRYSRYDTEHKYGWKSLWEEVAYWRKANMIHNWFVENVQNGEDDCGTYEVTEENLADLLDICERVLDASKLVDGKVYNGTTYSMDGVTEHWDDGKVIEDPSVAEELLPTASGFFFGGTNYDQYYYEALVYTAKQLNEILETTDFAKEMVVYHASW